MSKQKNERVRDKIFNALLRTLGLFLWLGWLLLGLVLSLGLFSQLHQQFQARNYAETTATITMTNPHRKKDEDGHIYYVFHVRYAYQVEGSDYFCSRFSHFTDVVARSPEKNIPERFSLGANLPAYYNPQHPENAVLNRNITPWHVMPLLLLLPFTFIGIVPVLMFADEILYRLRWSSLGEYRIKFVHDTMQILLSVPGLFLHTGLFVLAAMMLCVLFLLPYLLFFNLNTLTATIMILFIFASGVFGLVFTEARLHEDAKKLIIDFWAGTILIPKSSVAEQEKVSFSEIVAFEIKADPESKSGEKLDLFAHCVRDERPIQFFVTESYDKNSLTLLKSRLEKITIVSRRLK